MVIDAKQRVVIVKSNGPSIDPKSPSMNLKGFFGKFPVELDQVELSSINTSVMKNCLIYKTFQLFGLNNQPRLMPTAQMGLA